MASAYLLRLPADVTGPQARADRGIINMKLQGFRTSRWLEFVREAVAMLCVASFLAGNAAQAANPAQQEPASAESQAAKLPADQLDSLVAPIALYPDPMLS